MKPTFAPATLLRADGGALFPDRPGEPVTRIHLDGLAHLRGLHQLNTLYLYGTRVTDRGLPSLYGLKKLGYVNVQGLPLSDRALRELREALPGAHIDTK